MTRNILPGLSLFIVMALAANLPAGQDPAKGEGRVRLEPLVKSLPDIHAVFIDDKNKVYLSPGTNKLFTITNSSYVLSE